MFGLFKRKKLIHEPLENQISDIKKLNPLIANKILKGLSCDKLENATGVFGSLTNPIPVNGPLGEIKYLGKLRGKTGHAVFFHRIGSAKSNTTDNLVDIFELVCQDGTQWIKLYFDPYHPRRSNFAPEEFSLMPFNKELKMDLPFAYGVTSFVTNFPFDLPKELDVFYGGAGAFSRHAKNYLEKYSFQRPMPKQNTQNFTSQKEIRSTDDIDNFTFITDIIQESLHVEKELLSNNQNQLMGYSNSKLFDSKYGRKLLIERFIFLRAFLELENHKELNTEDMYRYVAAIATKAYDINQQEAIEFLNKRQEFYLTELSMLKTFKHPHPGKIIWCLHNPTSEEMNHDITSCFEQNIVAGFIFTEAIIDTFKHLINIFGTQRN